MSKQYIPNVGRGTSDIPEHLPRVEWRRNGEETWTVWTYSSARDVESMKRAYERLVNLYPQWEFRLHEGGEP